MPVITRQFDIETISNCRFLYQKSGEVILGDEMIGSRLESSHAEEYYQATGTNAGFDECVRGWIGYGGDYPDGVIHFAPPIPPGRDGTWDRFDLAYRFLDFTKRRCGVTEKTIIRGFPGAWEQPLSDIMRKTMNESEGFEDYRNWLCETNPMVPRDTVFDMGNGMVAYAERLMFHWTLKTSVIGDKEQYEDRWCYEGSSPVRVLKALAEWKDRGFEGKPTGWRREPHTGLRRDDDGNPESERYAP